MYGNVWKSTIGAVAVVAALVPSAALAAPPANDERTAAQVLDSLPATVQGSTEEATVEVNERPPGCGPMGPSVWYSATADNAGRIAMKLAAAGDLDVTLDVFKSVRSRLDPLGCDLSDTKGNAAVNFAAVSGGHYLIRVSQRPDSVPGTFSLRVSAPVFPAQPPGTPLPAGGATRTLDRADNIDSAWSILLHSGTTYRVRLSGRDGRCSPTAVIYAPGTTSFEDGHRVDVLRCGQSHTFTPRPGEGGRYPIHVLASAAARRPQRYHLQVAVAGVDDSAPGLPIGNHRVARGGLRGDAVDALDLYRFDVTDRSRTTLTLTTSQQFQVSVLSERGRRFGTGQGSLEVTLRPGTYYAAVRSIGSAAGKYRLRRDSRVLTHTTLDAVASGLTATLTATTSPAASGPVRIVVERFDPLAGWLFADQFALRAAGGRAGTTFRGLQSWYRATAQFNGTRDAAACASRTVQFHLGVTARP
jgi:hypothetical protein